MCAVSEVEQPTLHALVGGRWSLLCGRCMLPSVPVDGPEAEQAWAMLKRLGWSYYWPGGNKNLTGYALCPKCSHEPEAPVKKRRRR